MTNLDRILYLGGASACIAFGLLGKNFRWGGMGIRGPRLPRWLGAGLFIAGGIWLLYEAAIHW